MTTASRFDRFLRNISPDRGDYIDMRTKRDEVGRKLHSTYYSSIYDGGSVRVIGSYGKGTEVSPVRDLDLMFLLPSREYSRWDGYSGNGQSALLQEIRRILAVRYPRTDISGDGQVVVVPFQAGHSVEVLPAWKLDSGRYRTPNTHRGGSWHDADHDAEFSFVDNADGAVNGNVRDAIKMMKTWQAYCSVPIKSLALELRAVEFAKSWEYRGRPSNYYDWLVRDYLEELLAKVGSRHVVPGTQDKFSYGADWESRARTALARAEKACIYESQGSHSLAVAEWSKIFGPKFA